MMKFPRPTYSRIAGLLSALLLFGLGCAQAADLNKRQDVQAFIDRMVTQHGFDRRHLEADFRKIRLQPKIIAAMNRPAEAMPWYRYKKIFNKPRRINDGVAFWKKYRSTLARAEKTYGVDAQIIVAIIGVETLYGANKGSWRVIDALATLGFDYPRRGKFFQKELEEFLLLAKEERADPFSLKGSYAGAMGWGQFIPSSYRAYAVDFDGDGRRDLISNPVDAIGSVANYFKNHHWQKGDLVTLPATVKGSPKRRANLPDGNDKPTIPVSKLADYGISLKQRIKGDPLTNYIKLETAKGKFSPWVGFNNFYVITRYNRSPLYTMAVYNLSRAIKRKMR
jgi:membrane-bound lytic murein transglycosylase B